MRAALIAGVLATSADSGADTQLDEVSGGIAYSMVADVYREGGGEMAPAGPRIGVLAGRGRLVAGGALSAFASTTAAIVAVDVELGIRDDRERLGYRVGGGVGVLYTSDRTALPTYNDRHLGPSLHVGGALRARVATRVVAETGVGLYLYPLQPAPGWSIGADARWHLGLGYRWD